MSDVVNNLCLGDGDCLGVCLECPFTKSLLSKYYRKPEDNKGYIYCIGFNNPTYADHFILRDRDSHPNYTLMYGMDKIDKHFYTIIFSILVDDVDIQIENLHKFVGLNAKKGLLDGYAYNIPVTKILDFCNQMGGEMWINPHRVVVYQSEVTQGVNTQGDEEPCVDWGGWVSFPDEDAKYYPSCGPHMRRVS